MGATGHDALLLMSQVLHARQDDHRSATFQKALAMGEEFMRDTKALVLRINLMRNDFIVKVIAHAQSSTHASTAHIKLPTFYVLCVAFHVLCVACS